MFSVRSGNPAGNAVQAGARPGAPARHSGRGCSAGGTSGPGTSRFARCERVPGAGPGEKDSAPGAGDGTRSHGKPPTRARLGAKRTPGEASGADGPGLAVTGRARKVPGEPPARSRASAPDQAARCRDGTVEAPGPGR
jgi:hypothetical protein